MEEQDAVQEPRSDEASEPSAAPARADTGGLERVIDVSLRLTVEIGSSKLLLRDVLQLGKGSVVELDRNTGDPADLYVNGRLIGRGEVVTSDDRLAVRVIELTSGESRDRPG